VEAWDLTDAPIDMLVGFSHRKVGEEAARFMHGRGARHAAVITPTDRRARTRSQAFADTMHALIEARARGIAVPGQLRILGYGDLNFAAHTDPPLSTMRIDGTLIGTLAASMLIDRIEDRKVAGKVKDVGFKLIERVSA